jgi:hypothetical protein
VSGKGVERALDSDERLERVERRLSSMCTHAVLSGWRWWRPSWSAGYYAGLEAAWRVAFEEHYGAKPDPGASS